MLHEDLKVRDYLKKKLKNASVGRIAHRASGQERAHHDLLSARPGVVIGKKGEDIEALKSELHQASWACRCTSTSRKSASPKSTRS